MREYKFRAYDRKAKKMFPVHKLEWNKISNEMVHLSGVDIHDKDSDSEGDVYYGGHPNKKTGNPGESQVQRFVLMQFTGLKDKNGKEAYEGDVALLLDDVLEPKKILIKNIWDIHSVELDCYEEFEIIGNIHDNPELLEETK